MLTISAMNVWNVKRLGERVAKIEASLGGGRRSGPDPNRVHTVKTAGAPTKGPETAPVTIVEFSEFQCPFCARVVPTLKQIEDTYQDRVRIVWKHLPLPNHKDAVGAALAAEAARKQGKFWEYHDKLFANQNRLGPDDLKQHAKDLQLDLKRFEADLLNATRRRRSTPTSRKRARSVSRGHPASLSTAGSSLGPSHSRRSRKSSTRSSRNGTCRSRRGRRRTENRRTARAQERPRDRESCHV